MEEKKVPQLKIKVNSKPKKPQAAKKAAQKPKAQDPVLPLSVQAVDADEVMLAKSEERACVQTMKVVESSSLVQLLKQRWMQYYPAHKHQVWYALAGFLFACGCLYLGIFKTLVIAGCTLIGMIYGRSVDKGVSFRTLIVRLIENDRL